MQRAKSGAIECANLQFLLLPCARGVFFVRAMAPGRGNMVAPTGGPFYRECVIGRSPTRQLGADKRWPGLRQRAGIRPQAGCGRPSMSLAPVLTCGRDARTLFVSKERRNTILILHEPCHSGAQPLVLRVRIPSVIPLRPIYLMCRATGAAVRRACSRTTHKILSILGNARGYHGPRGRDRGRRWGRVLPPPGRGFRASSPRVHRRGSCWHTPCAM